MFKRFTYDVLRSVAALAAFGALQNQYDKYKDSKKSAR